MVSSGMLRRVALVRTDVSGEFSASFIRVTRIGELGTTLAVTINRRTLSSMEGPVYSGEIYPSAVLSTADLIGPDPIRRGRNTVNNRLISGSARPKQLYVDVRFEVFTR
jgi:hypothetical protein